MAVMQYCTFSWVLRLIPTVIFTLPIKASSYSIIIMRSNGFWFLFDIAFGLYKKGILVRYQNISQLFCSILTYPYLCTPTGALASGNIINQNQIYYVENKLFFTVRPVVPERSGDLCRGVHWSPRSNS